MYDFLERLISIALPRTRDFRGYPLSLLTRKVIILLVLKEQIIFTEINYDKIDSVRGMDINISTTATLMMKLIGFCIF